MSLRKLEPFLNVVASGRATLNSKVVLGNLIKRVILQLGGTTFTKAMITLIRVKLNTKTVWEISGTNLNTLRSYNALAGTNATHLVLDFADINARTIKGEDIGGIDTVAQGITDFVVEVDIVGALAPTLVAWVELSPPLLVLPGQALDGSEQLFRALLQSTLTFTAAGEFTVDVGLGSRGGALIRQIAFYHGGILTQYQQLIDGVEQYQEVGTALHDFRATDYGRVPQPNLFVFDPTINGDQGTAVRTLRPDGSPRTFQHKFTVTGAGVITAYADVYTALPLI